MKIEEITILVNSSGYEKGKDILIIKTDLPTGTYPFTGNQVLTIEVEYDQGLSHVKTYFPEINNVNILNIENGELNPVDIERSIKTVIIFNLVPEEIKYYIVNKSVYPMDMRIFNGVFINSGENLDLEEKLNNIIYTEEGRYKHKTVTLDQIKKAIVDGANIIECGFIM